MTSGSPGRHARAQQTPAEPPAPGRQFLNSTTARRAGIAAGVLMAAGGLALAIDWSLSSGQAPRGVQVAGIDIGGLSHAQAQTRLELELNQRVAQPLTVGIGDVRTDLVPSDAGLSVDWDGTWNRIGDQPLNPFTRVWSLFGTRDVEPAVFVDDAAMTEQLDALRTHDRQPVEGGVVFEQGRPVPVRPVPGRVLDVPAARTALTEHWADGSVLELPAVETQARVRAEAVDKALREIAQPAVRVPVTFTGKGGNAVLDPGQLAGALSFQPNGQGGLELSYNRGALIAALEPQLKATVVEPKDATFALASGRATVVPAVVGDTVNWDKTLEGLPALLVSAEDKSKAVVYEQVQPKLTTADAERFGVVQSIGSFTTGGFSGPSGVNIRTVARKVDGAVIRPGDTFSLNDFTGTRGVEQGYVESGIIDHGRPGTAVGGGISQFATTLYNAAYFAGMEDVDHTEHSYYISRYPAAREATVFDGAIDLKFRNNTPYGVYIETVAGDSEVTVRLWSTKTVEVESIAGERTKPTEPNTVTLPKGKNCIASDGAPGFTTSDTRIIRDAKTGKEIYRHTRTVKYDPVPVVKCE
ncbi:VanW family protein [Nocardia sp. NBC_01503]|uniref:VanW family protein n=1 Tax=Nocardia sp. NBC_01503 TaxID=2975997 RepID=UPI002E7B6FB4|nr:VanW family protein [Nocardia sp. NBC_01503]WTL34962.1 VanW family protein [Nocardia sp. NBC_01503]